MQLRRHGLAVMFVAVLGLAGATQITYAGEPLELVKSAAEGAIAVLKDPKLKSPNREGNASSV